MSLDKNAILARIQTLQRKNDELRKMIDELTDEILKIEEPQPVQPVKAINYKPEVWLTPKQASKYLNISITTFYSWVAQGILPPGKPFSPKSKRWRKSEIDEWQKNVI